MKSRLSAAEYDHYIQSNVITNFKPLIEQELHSFIINRDLQIEIATKFAAKAFGTTNESNIGWICFANYQDEEFLQRLFGQSYERYQKDWLAFHLKKLVYLFIYNKWFLKKLW